MMFWPEDTDVSDEQVLESFENISTEVLENFQNKNPEHKEQIIEKRIRENFDFRGTIDVNVRENGEIHEATLNFALPEGGTTVETFRERFRPREQQVVAQPDPELVDGVIVGKLNRNKNLFIARS